MILMTSRNDKNSRDWTKDMYTAENLHLLWARAVTKQYCNMMSRVLTYLSSLFKNKQEKKCFSINYKNTNTSKPKHSHEGVSANEQFLQILYTLQVSPASFHKAQGKTLGWFNRFEANVSLPGGW